MANWFDQTTLGENGGSLAPSSQPTEVVRVGADASNIEIDFDNVYVSDSMAMKCAIYLSDLAEFQVENVPFKESEARQFENLFPKDEKNVIQDSKWSSIYWEKTGKTIDPEKDVVITGDVQRLIKYCPSAAVLWASDEVAFMDTDEWCTAMELKEDFLYKVGKEKGFGLSSLLAWYYEKIEIAVCFAKEKMLQITTYQNIELKRWLTYESARLSYRNMAFERLLKIDPDFLEEKWNDLFARMIPYYSKDLRKGSANIKPILATIGWMHSSNFHPAMRKHSQEIFTDTQLMFRMLCEEEILGSEIPLLSRPGYMYSVGGSLPCHVFKNVTELKGERTLVFPAMRPDDPSRYSVLRIEQSRYDHCIREFSEEKRGVAYMHVPPFRDVHYHVIHQNKFSTATEQFVNVIAEDLRSSMWKPINAKKSQKTSCPKVSIARLASFNHAMYEYQVLRPLIPAAALSFISVFYTFTVPEWVVSSSCPVCLGKRKMILKGREDKCSECRGYGKIELKKQAQALIDNVNKYYFELGSQYSTVNGRSLRVMKGKMNREGAIWSLWSYFVQFYMTHNKFPAFLMSPAFHGDFAIDWAKDAVLVSNFKVFLNYDGTVADDQGEVRAEGWLNFVPKCGNACFLTMYRNVKAPVRKTFEVSYGKGQVQGKKAVQNRSRVARGPNPREDFAGRGRMTKGQKKRFDAVDEYVLDTTS